MLADSGDGEGEGEEVRFVRRGGGGGVSVDIAGWLVGVSGTQAVCE